MRVPGSNRRGGQGKIEVPMTPMIDIVFQLIIFFMLMPSFEAKEGYLPTNLPDTLGQQKTDMKKQNEFRIDLLHIEPWEQHKAEAVIRLNSEELRDNADLRSRLRQAHQNLMGAGADIEKVPVLISPDMVVWHKHVVAAFDAAIDAGFKNIQFTVPK